jgi:hypothetical protein
MKTSRYFSILLSLLLSACATIPTSSERKATADGLVQARGWRAERVTSGPFDLVTYSPNAPKRSTLLTVYIEGDGFAWISQALASSDPTPRDPLALRLALAQPDESAAYLARPCQYVDAEVTGCALRYWTNARFSDEVVVASNIAIDSLKRRFKAEKLILVGYSGGAAVAALVAARRQDVALLVSVAGNLDPLAWTRYHHLQPLSGSLNPVDEAGALQRIPQIYFAGEHDRNLPPALVRAYASKLSSGNPPVLVEPGFDHQCCWITRWPTLWRQSLTMMLSN